MAFSVNEFRSQMTGDGARPNLFEVTMPFPTFSQPANAQSKLFLLLFSFIFLSFRRRRNHIIFSYFLLFFSSIFSVLAPFPLGRVGVGTIYFPLFPMLYPMQPIYCKLPAFRFLQWNPTQFLLPLDSAIYDFYSKKYVS